MMHPSEALIQAARRQMERRGSAEKAASRYGLLSDEFTAESHRDRFGLRQCLLEIEGPAGILPPVVPTLRGKIGHWVVQLQARSLWWVIRALRLEARALRAVYATLRHEQQRLTRHEDTEAREIAEIKRRLARIERCVNFPSEEKAEP